MWWSFLKFLACAAPCRFAIGTIYIGASDDFDVVLPWTPAQIWAEFEAVHGVPVCVGDKDGFDIAIVEDGFVVSATLKSESREIKWFAIK